MKIAIVTDTHFGMRNNNETFLKSQFKFIRNQFIPYLDKNKIENIWIGGDIFDNRTNLNVKTFNIVYDLFKNELSKYEIKIILGNHDILHKTTNDIFSLKFLESFDNVTLYKDEMVTEKIGNKTVTFIPWINDYESFPEKVKNIKSDIALAHVDIIGCKMNELSVSERGLNPTIFLDNFNLTLSGHYHKRSEIKRNDRSVTYLGSMCQMNFGDFNNERGFNVLDINNSKLTFIENQESIKFEKINYPDKIEEEIVRDNCVQVIFDYKNESNNKQLQKYMLQVESFEPALPVVTKIIGQYVNKPINECKQDYEGSSIESLLEEYVGDCSIVGNVQKDEVLNIIKDLYNFHKGINDE